MAGRSRLVDHRQVRHRFQEGGELHKHEDREQAPEIGAEVELQPRPGEVGQAHPWGVHDDADIVEAQGHGDNQTNGHGHRQDPHTPDRSILQGDQDSGGQRRDSRQQEQEHGLAFRQDDRPSDDEWHGGSRHQHDRDSAHSLCEYPVQGGKAQGQDILDQGGDHQQTGQQTRSAGVQRQSADGQERNVEVGDNEAA